MSTTKPEPPLARRWHRRVAIGTALLLLVALACLLLLPTVLSQRWIYQPLLAAVHASDHRLSVESLSAGWLHPLEIEGLAITDPERHEIVRIRLLESELTLLDAVFGRRDLGRVVLHDPVVNVQMLQQDTNIGRFAAALDARLARPREQRHPPAVNLDLDVRNLRVNVQRQPGGMPADAAPLLETRGTNFVVRYRAANGRGRILMEDAALLDHVQLTPELVDLGLELAVPALYRAGGLEGEVSVDIAMLDIPLDAPEQGHMEGTIQLHQATSTARSPLILTLLDWASVILDRPLPRQMVIAEAADVHFEMRDQQMWHRGLKFGFPEWDPRIQFHSQGRVGLDHSLDLVIAVPVPVEQIARRDAVRSLGVPTVDVHVTGTLEDPVIDLSQSREQLARLVAEILRRRRGDALPAEQDPLEDPAASTEEMLIEEGVRALGGLLQTLRERRAAAEGAAAEESGAPAEEPLERGGLLRRLLRRGESRDQEPAEPPPREAF